MSLDSTTRETNLLDSLKKYFIDNLKTAEGVDVFFDPVLSVPKVAGKDLEKWVAFDLGELEVADLSNQDITVFICTRKDPEGFKNAQLRDKVLGYLIDETQTDGLARIPFYKSNVTPWEQVSTMVILLGPAPESGRLTAEDGTKIKAIYFRVKWGAKC